jgi:hypothetical protein
MVGYTQSVYATSCYRNGGSRRGEPSEKPQRFSTILINF